MGRPLSELFSRFEAFRASGCAGYQSQYEALAANQQPRVLFIACSDSRVAPELLFQAGPGDLFVCRNIGNIIPRYGAAQDGVAPVIEYAVAALNVESVVVCGHSNCGAMRALLDPAKAAHLHSVGPWLEHARPALQALEREFPSLDGAEKLKRLTERNVAAQIEHLETHPSVATRLRRGDIEIHGMVFDVGPCEFRALEPTEGRFIGATNPLPAVRRARPLSTPLNRG